MRRTSSLADRLFWPILVGGAASLWFGPKALGVAGLVALVLVLHRLGRGGRFRRRVRAIARRHRETLALRRRQESYVDPYGNEILDGWLRERSYFADRTVLPRLEAEGYGDLIAARYDEILDIVEAASLSVVLPPCWSGRAGTRAPPGPRATRAPTWWRSGTGYGWWCSASAMRSPSATVRCRKWWRRAATGMPTTRR